MGLRPRILDVQWSGWFGRLQLARGRGNEIREGGIRARAVSNVWGLRLELKYVYGPGGRCKELTGTLSIHDQIQKRSRP